MRFLRTNTAVIVTVGPFYDKTDGVTIETALTITNERITLTADTDAGSAPTNILNNIAGATSATANDLNYIASNSAGLMQLELEAANVNRLGRMFLSITDAANHVPVFHEFTVLPQAIYDWLIAGTIVPLPANVTQLLGTAWLAPAVAGTPDVNTKSNTTGAITTAAFAAGAINAAALAADAGAEIADAVWDEDATGHQTQGSFGQAIGDPVADTNTLFKAVVTDATGATVGVDVVAVKAETVTILADTNDIQTRLPAALVGGTRMDSSVGAMAADVVTAAAVAADAGAEIAAAVWDKDATGHQTLGTFGQAIGDPVADTNTIYKAVVTDATGATVGIDVVAVKAQTVAIEADTAEIGAAGAGLTAINLPNQTMDITGNITGNVSGSVGSVTGAVGSVTGAVGSVTGLTVAHIDAAITSRATPAQVNTEVLDVLNTDTFAEPGQGAPGATVSLITKIGYLYKAWRNKSTQTSTTFSLYADDTTTVDQKSTLSDDATTFVSGEKATGP